MSIAAIHRQQQWRGGLYVAGSNALQKGEVDRLALCFVPSPFLLTGGELQREINNTTCIIGRSTDKNTPIGTDGHTGDRESMRFLHFCQYL